MMDPLLADAIRAGERVAHLVTVEFGLSVIRWTDGGFVVWEGEIYRARDATYGVLDQIGDITDGIDVEASPVSIRIKTPDLASLADLASMDAQGGLVQIHLAAISEGTGLLIGEPYRLHFGELDQPKLVQGLERALDYDIITGEARGLQPNEEQRQTDAFRRLVWPGERGDEYATDGTKVVYWREDTPRNAIGILTGRGGGDERNKAIEFSYEPNAPLAFPMGRCAVGGTIRYRVGYGPTNRFQSIFATAGASGPIKDLIKVTFDDEETDFDGDDRATNGSHDGAMWFSFLPGDQPSVALTSPTGPEADGGAAPGWGADHKLSGRPAFCWTGKENSKKDEFRGNEPKPVLTMEGLYGYDPRQVGCVIDDPSTWPWLDNGVAWGLNWCIGRWEGLATGYSPARYGVPYASFLVGGIGSPLNMIDVDAFVAAADIADLNNWKAAGVPLSDMDKADVLDDLLQAGGAVRIRKCGMISCFSRGAVEPSLMDVTQADTAGRPDITLGVSRLERKNTATGDFWSEGHRWEMMPIRAISNNDWVTEDGGRQTTGFTYRYCPDPDQTAAFVYLDLADGREKISGTSPFKLYMLAIEPGKCFTWQEPEYLLDGVKVRVLKRTYSPSTCDLKLTFRQETDAKVAQALAQVGVVPNPSVPDTPPVPEVAEPTGFDTSLAGSVVTLTWTNAADGDYYRTLVYRGSTNVFGAATLIGSRGGVLGEVMTYTNSPGTGTWYYWIVAENFVGDASDPVGPSSEVVP